MLTGSHRMCRLLPYCECQCTMRHCPCQFIFSRSGVCLDKKGGEREGESGGRRKNKKSVDTWRFLWYYKSRAKDSAVCASGGIGRLAGFRCQCSQGRAGSTPASRTTKKDIQPDVLFCLYQKTAHGDVCRFVFPHGTWARLKRPGHIFGCGTEDSAGGFPMSARFWRCCSRSGPGPGR